MPGKIPQRFIDDLLDRVDIVDIIGARIDLRRTGKNHSARCPFHDEKTPSFSVSPEKQFFYCFGCGAGGNAIGFVMDYDRIDFPRAVAVLAATVGMTVPTEANSDDPRSKQRRALYDILETADRYYREQLREPVAAKAIAYLRQRGLSGEIARDFGIGYAPAGWENLIQLMDRDETKIRLLIEAGLAVEREDERRIYDRFRDRVMFPIRDNRGRTIAFGGRVLGDDKPKYLNSPETPVFQKRRELYGLYEASRKRKNLDRLLVVEGYMDVLALAQFGIDNAVATLGTATTLEHLEKIFRHTSEVVFCFDGDEAGRKAAQRALETALPAMTDGRSAKFLFMPEGEDPDTLVRQIGADAFRRQLTEAQPLSAFLFDLAGAGLDRSLPDDRARLSQRAAPLINQLPEGVFRQLLLDQLALETGLATDTLRQFIVTQGSARNSDPSPPNTAIPTALDDGSVDRDGGYDDSDAFYAREQSFQIVTGAGHAATDAAYRGKRVKLPPVLWLTGLLAHHPRLAQLIDPEQIEQLRVLDAPDMDLLLTLIELVRDQADIPLYLLLGHWRGTQGQAQHDRLNAVVNNELITAIDDARGAVETLFRDVLERLLSDARQRLPAERLIAHLAAKSSLGDEDRKMAIDLWHKLRATGAPEALINEIKQILSKRDEVKP